jgi:hypothetical protein
MDKEQVLQKLASGEIGIAEAKTMLEGLEQDRRGTLYCKVSPKGALSVYGLQRMPVTLYAEQWGRLLDFGDKIRQFMAEHDDSLKKKSR